MILLSTHKASPPEAREKTRRKAFTLVELTLVMGLVVGLSMLSMFGLSYFSGLSKASRAEAVLKQVENARMSFLADNPTASFTSIQTTDIDPYLQGGWAKASAAMSTNGYVLFPSDIRNPLITYGMGKSPLRIKGFLAR